MHSEQRNKTKQFFDIGIFCHYSIFLLGAISNKQ